MCSSDLQSKEMLWYGGGSSVGSSGTPSFGGINTTGGFAVISAITSGTRWARIWAKGRFRVSGSGSTVKFYPTLQTNVTGDNLITALRDCTFRVSTINSGSSTSTGQGTWS